MNESDDQRLREISKWWWINVLPVGYTKEESGAAVRLIVTAGIMFFAIAAPVGGLTDTFGVGTELSLWLMLSALIPAFLLARPIVGLLSPDALKVGDEANIKRMAVRKHLES